MKQEPKRWLDVEPASVDDATDPLRALMQVGADDVAPPEVLARTARRLTAGIGVSVTSEFAEQLASHAGKMTTQVVRAKSGWLLALKGLGGALLVAAGGVAVQYIGASTQSAKQEARAIVVATAAPQESRHTATGSASEPASPRRSTPQQERGAAVTARAPLVLPAPHGSTPDPLTQSRPQQVRSAASVGDAPLRLAPEANRQAVGSGPRSRIAQNADKPAAAGVPARWARPTSSQRAAGAESRSAHGAAATEAQTGLPDELATASGAGRGDAVATRELGVAGTNAAHTVSEMQSASSAAKSVNGPPPLQATRLEELRALEQAQRDLRFHPRRALTALHEHAARFPSSWLAQERDALTIHALLGLRERSKAQAALKAFVARYPESALIDELEQAASRR